MGVSSRTPFVLHWVVALGVALLLTGLLSACGEQPIQRSAVPIPPERLTVLIPKDVALDPLPENPQLAEAITLGARLVRDTHTLLPDYVGNGLTCSNCHINGGQKVGALPWVGIAPQFPEYNARAGRIISLEERINGCFRRSMNGSPLPGDSPELKAIAAYITWISEDQPAGVNPPWRGQSRIADDERLPITDLDPAHGQTLYGQHCAACHQQDGQGIAGTYPPLWGPDSFNDGAGAARVYTLAGFIRTAMPLGRENTLSARDAQQIAAYLDSQDRPAFASKAQDYPGGTIPPDAVYYQQLYPEHPLRVR